jgi:hypothetical protein
MDKPTWSQAIENPGLFTSEEHLELAHRATEEITSEWRTKLAIGGTPSRKDARTLYMVFAFNSALKGLQMFEEAFAEAQKVAEEEAEEAPSSLISLPGRDF